MKPVISVVLPTYNRANFLENAFASLAQQTFTEFELIVVDDGSTDHTEQLLPSLASQAPFQVIFIQQENMGPAGARNTGIKKASGQFIAFFDSDDEWDNDFLETGIDILNRYAHIDWIYRSCRRIDLSSKTLLQKSTFYTNEEKNSLFECASTIDGLEGLYQIDSIKGARAQIIDGIDCGFQNSILRRKVIETIAIPNFRVGEDRLFILMALKANFTLAFFDHPKVTYYVHENNTSDTNPESTNIDRRIESICRLISSYEATSRYVALSDDENRALSIRLSEDYFWKLGYSLELNRNNRKGAIRVMLKGIKYYPYKIKYWKTLLVTIIRALT